MHLVLRFSGVVMLIVATSVTPLWLSDDFSPIPKRSESQTSYENVENSGRGL